MKAAIHNPYLDTLGGGERYTVSFAKVLVDEGWDVDLEWSGPDIKDSLNKRFGIDLSKVNIVSDIKRGDGYDLCFWISDGSIPALKSRKNILHFQVPFHGVNGASLMNKMKLFRINEIVCNSEFTKKVIDEEYGVNSKVIYPPIDTESFKSKRKENIILYVGRFSKLKQNKHQEVLIKTFIELVDSGLKDWKLVLAGGSEVGSGTFIQELKRMIIGYPIQIIESPDFKTLKSLYGVAKIFWSAAGYLENETENPENMEHFGMSVVEAMACGEVPIVYNGGGHKEIIKHNIEGFLWEDVSLLSQKTMEIINDKKSLTRLSRSSVLSSKRYTFENFRSQCVTLLLK